MSEDQIYEAAEREMDLYRAEIERITAARDEYRDNAILHVRERDEARAELDQLRKRFAYVAAALDSDALATQPSKKSQIQADAARRIREALA